MSLTLYFHPLSSFCWKPLIAIYEAGVPFTPKMVDLGDPAERAAFQAVWPLAKFPVLRDEARGQQVPEATIIIDYLARTCPAAAPRLPPPPAPPPPPRPPRAAPPARPPDRQLRPPAVPADRRRAPAPRRPEGPLRR